uniref:Uncharacterized protein n=1 Tax=viral metagenome TaxID=1070528 RepID=A0A6C0C022_9ZZZZ
MKRPLQAQVDKDLDGSLCKHLTSEEDIVQRAVKCIRVRLTDQIAASVSSRNSLKACTTDAYNEGYTQGCHDTQLALLEWVEEEIREIHRHCRARVLKEMEDAALTHTAYTSLAAVAPFERSFAHLKWDVL